jgi:PRTRC genetic system protein F
MSFAPIALPSLADIPGVYTISSGESFAYPLVRSLLESGVIEDQDVVRRPRSELALATAALTRRWDRITDGMQLFDWNLRIDQALDGYSFDSSKQTDQVWAMVQTTHGPVSCRQISIGGAINALEQVREGLGQTLLAALYDACNMLPTICTPAYAFGLAQYTYWYGESDESFAIEEAMSLHDCQSREELIETFDFFTQDKFFRGMPKWRHRRSVFCRAPRSSAPRLSMNSPPKWSQRWTLSGTLRASMGRSRTSGPAVPDSMPSTSLSSCGGRKTTLSVGWSMISCNTSLTVSSSARRPQRHSPSWAVTLRHGLSRWKQPPFWRRLSSTF